MKILSVVGARPNFMKIALLIKQMRQYHDIAPVLVHTGQHYDATMAGQFFHELQIPAPDIALGVGGGSHAHQTAEVMKRLEPVLEQTQPNLVVVVGDVNSTLAAALTAAKLHIAPQPSGRICLVRSRNHRYSSTVRGFRIVSLASSGSGMGRTV